MLKRGYNRLDYIRYFGVRDVAERDCTIIDGASNKERNHAMELRNVNFILFMFLL
jgi:hypothetical protein